MAFAEKAAASMPSMVKSSRTAPDAAREQHSAAGQISRHRVLTGKDTSGEITVAAVADDGDDDGVLRLAGYLQRRPQRAARRDAGEDAFLARQTARRLFGVDLGHVHDAIDARPVADLRQVLRRPLSNARDLRALGGLTADHLDLRVLLLEEARAAHDGA